MTVLSAARRESEEEKKNQNKNKYSVNQKGMKKVKVIQHTVVM